MPRSTQRQDLQNALDVTQSIEPAGNRTATTNGTGADTKDHQRTALVAFLGVITDGTWTPIAEESDTLGSGYTAVAAADLSGAFTAATSATDQAVQSVGYKGSKRYVRVTLEETVASTTGALFSAAVVGFKDTAF